MSCTTESLVIYDGDITPLDNSSLVDTIDYVMSSDNMSDPLTNGLVREAVERSSKGMGLRLRTSQHDGNSI